jgi:inhibitor of cysteine peptidase
MSKKFIKIALFVLFVALLAACGKKEMSVGRAENGGTVELKTGETLMISLDSNPSTGYSWEIQETDETLLKLKGDPEFVQPPDNGTPIVGAGGTQVFRFEALKAGTTTLTLVYHRPWEKDVAPIDTYSLTVAVK